MHEDDIAVAVLADFERLSSADRDHPDLDTGLLRKRGQ
jgi:hypothetical protein